MKEFVISFFNTEATDVYINCFALDISRIGEDIVLADGVMIQFVASIDRIYSPDKNPIQKNYLN